MSQINKYCVVITTYANEKVGESIINSLMNKKLAACIQVQDIKSYYSWRESVHIDSEKMIMIKTKKDLYEEVEKDILDNHNYDIPEIIQIPINGGLSSYLNWIDKECQ